MFAMSADLLNKEIIYFILKSSCIQHNRGMLNTVNIKRINTFNHVIWIRIYKYDFNVQFFQKQKN